MRSSLQELDSISKYKLTGRHLNLSAPESQIAVIYAKNVSYETGMLNESNVVVLFFVEL